MNRDIASADDVTGLRAALGTDAPRRYLDQQHLEALQAATRRWPLLLAIRRERGRALRGDASAARA